MWYVFVYVRMCVCVCVYESGGIVWKTKLDQEGSTQTENMIEIRKGKKEIFTKNANKQYEI